jgi:hypothetical protein
MTDANSVGEIGGPPSIEDAIRVKSCSAEGSAWLRCVPHRRELWMANNAFVHAVNFRFGRWRDIGSLQKSYSPASFTYCHFGPLCPLYISTIHIVYSGYV